MTSKAKGQYFTTNPMLQAAVHRFIKNRPRRILEPSFGRGDLVRRISKQGAGIVFDLYEIDPTVPVLPQLMSKNINIRYIDFLKASVPRTYSTIIGNPPFVRRGRGNLYIDFTCKCFELLAPGGELVFITPASFFKLESSAKLLSEMTAHGSFTDVYRPENCRLFAGASVDVAVWRYEKDRKTNRVLYNGEKKYTHCRNGMITFHDSPPSGSATLVDYFQIVAGLKGFSKHPCGNARLITGCDQRRQYKLDFNDIKRRANWKVMRRHQGEPCIYIHERTHRDRVAFRGTVDLFHADLIMLLPQTPWLDLDNVVDYLNDTMFRSHFLEGRVFKIGKHKLRSFPVPEEPFEALSEGQSWCAIVYYCICLVIVITVVTSLSSPRADPCL